MVRIALSQTRNVILVMLLYYDDMCNGIITVEFTVQTVRIRKGSLEIEVPYETDQERNKILADLLGSEISRATATAKVSVSGEKKSKFVMPTSEQVENFIVQQPEYAHSIPMVGKHFSGGAAFKASSENSNYISLRNRVLVAQDYIAQKHKGKWVVETDPDRARVKLFKFRKE